MSLSELASRCVPKALSFPVIFGAEFLSIDTRLVQNYTASGPSEMNQNPDEVKTRTTSFCNVTITHTHPGKNDTVVTRVWLPVDPEWNGRYQAIGGGGWAAGLTPSFDLMMSRGLAEGYATSTFQGGVPSDDPNDWALLSPGNVNLLLLDNFASVALHDGALATKSVIDSFYGRPPQYSYWSGCSQGGRQGLMFAQRYPDVFDGIEAAAPAVNWAQFFIGSQFAQQVMNELGEYPHPCELDALTLAAIKACDADDGLLDDVISDPDSCHFDPFSIVGTPLNCTTPNSPPKISKTAAIVADAAWNGARASDGSLLWYTFGRQANLTGPLSAAITNCSTGVCAPVTLPLLSDWTRLFVKKDPGFNVSELVTRGDYEKVFRARVREYESIIGTNSHDLKEFEEGGGKMITWHGTADEIIPYNNTRHYYDAVTTLQPNIRDFYRLFEAPGVAHCSGGNGGLPFDPFRALVKWVEGGIAPEKVNARSTRNLTSELHLYPFRY